MSPVGPESQILFPWPRGLPRLAGRRRRRFRSWPAWHAGSAGARRGRRLDLSGSPANGRVPGMSEARSGRRASASGRAGGARPRRGAGRGEGDGWGVASIDILIYTCAPPACAGRDAFPATRLASAASFLPSRQAEHPANEALGQTGHHGGAHGRNWGDMRVTHRGNNLPPAFRSPSAPLPHPPAPSPHNRNAPANPATPTAFVCL